MQLHVRNIAYCTVACQHAAVAAGDVAVLHSHERLADVHRNLAPRQRDHHTAVAQVNKRAVEGKNAHGERSGANVTSHTSYVTRHTSHIMQDMLPAENLVQQNAAAITDGDKNGGGASAKDVKIGTLQRCLRAWAYSRPTSLNEQLRQKSEDPNVTVAALKLTFSIALLSIISALRSTHRATLRHCSKEDDVTCSQPKELLTSMLSRH